MDNQISNGVNNIRVALTIFLGLFVVVVVVILLSKGQQKESIQINSINSFSQCVAAGYPVMESFPRQCAVPKGRSFVEELVVQECAILADCPTGMACINHVCQKLN